MWARTPNAIAVLGVILIASGAHLSYALSVPSPATVRSVLMADQHHPGLAAAVAATVRVLPPTSTPSDSPAAGHASQVADDIQSAPSITSAAPQPVPTATITEQQPRVSEVQKSQVDGPVAALPPSSAPTVGESVASGSDAQPLPAPTAQVTAHAASAPSGAATPTTAGSSVCNAASTNGPAVDGGGAACAVGDASHAVSSSVTAPAVAHPTSASVATTTTLTLPPSLIYGNEAVASFHVNVKATNRTPTGTATVTSSAGLLCTFVLSGGKGLCSLTPTQLAPGSSTNVVASYIANGIFAGSTSSAIQSLWIAKEPTTTEISESQSSVTSGAEAASVFTGEVITPYGQAVPTGERVTVGVGPAACTIALTGSTGACSIAINALAVGSYPVTATYGGDADLRTSTSSSASSLTVTAATAPPTSFRQGVYTGPADPTGISAFASATGTEPTIASDYLPANSGWAGLDGAYGSLSWLLSRGWHGTGYTLSLGVPMIPTNAANVPLGTLAIGATGAYNTYFVKLAQALVAAGDAGAFLRLGWEFDGSWYAWNALTPAAEANYAAYFQQIVTAMRSVPGEAFSFVWNPDAAAFTTPGYSVAAAYPGNAYVNYIGLDAYDQSWSAPLTPANAWASTTLPALTAAQNFAATQGEPIALCEWGVEVRSDGHGLGDDPLYVSNMVAWMENPANNVAYESYFDYNTMPSGGGTNADLTGGTFPNSLTAFVSNLG
jgi:hypothetical protein